MGRESIGGNRTHHRALDARQRTGVRGPRAIACLPLPKGCCEPTLGGEPNYWGKQIGNLLRGGGRAGPPPPC